MINLAPWFYRELLEENQIIDSPRFFKAKILTGEELFEAICTLKSTLRPEWVACSVVYNNCDGAGTSKYKNIAVYKAISEALERWAFYTTADIDEKKFCFDLNPTTTGMAAYPSFTAKNARDNSILEANERWAIHEFWRGNLPAKERFSSIQNLRHLEIITPFKNCNISIVVHKVNDRYLYAFAAGKSLKNSFHHALVELARNVRVMKKLEGAVYVLEDFDDISDRRLFYFSSEEGHDLFDGKVKYSPLSIKANPRVICDLEMRGEWSLYTKVWRYLYDGSYPDSDSDHSFFMF